MELFHVTADFSFNIPFDDGNNVPINLRKPETKPNISSIYAATGADVETFRQHMTNNKNLNLPKDFKIKVLNTMDKRKIFGMESFPKFLSNFDSSLQENDFPYADPIHYKRIPSTPIIPLEEQIADIDGDEIKVFFINGMGTGLGDGMIGLAALNIFYRRLQKKYNKVTIDLAQPGIIGDKSHRALYDQESIINSYSYLPVTVEKLLEYDLIMDNSAMLVRENFPINTMMDFYLENLGIDPKSVSVAEKKIHIKTSELAKKMLSLPLKLLRQKNTEKLMGLDIPTDKLILLHCSASTPLRSMPRDLIKKAIKKILDADPSYHVVTWERMDDIKKDIDATLADKKHRHTNLFFKNMGFDFYTHIISQVDAVVSVDTSCYHIASAFDIPSVAIFQSIDPAIRIKDYPYCAAIELSQDKTLRGIHISDKPEHLKLLTSYWLKFNWRSLTDALVDVLDKRSKLSKGLVMCPVCNFPCTDQMSDRLGNQELVECNNCGTEFAKTRKMANYDDMYEADYKHYISNGDSPEKIIENYIRQTRFEPYIDLMQTLSSQNLSYLDFGCASGFLVEYARRLGFDAYGIDISKEAIKFGQTTFKLNNRLAVGKSINDGAGFPKKFDVISSIEVLEHLKDPNAFAKDVANKLADNGYWFISTPNRDRIQFKAGVKNTKKHCGLESGDYPDEHLQRFRAKSHRHIVEAAGLEVFYQNTCRVAAVTAKDVSGEMPNLNLNTEDGKVLTIPKDVIFNFMLNYFQPLLDGTDGYGNFLVTIARKPKI